ncbi:DUF1328 domain-containing protein [Loktanella agnita]|uniref:DUF1328 domain-containing protein n=1 Tax=Loktanella agnita TaxID=287097 RepID=UPI003988BA69
MLNYALTFLAIALIAALFGYGGIATASAGIAQFIFVIFLLLFIGSLFLHAMRATNSNDRRRSESTQ